MGSHEEAKVRTVWAVGSEREAQGHTLRHQSGVSGSVPGLGQGGGRAWPQPGGIGSCQDENTPPQEVALQPGCAQIDRGGVDCSCARADISYCICMSSAATLPATPAQNSPIGYIGLRPPAVPTLTIPPTREWTRGLAKAELDLATLSLRCGRDLELVSREARLEWAVKDEYGDVVAEDFSPGGAVEMAGQVL